MVMVYYSRRVVSVGTLAELAYAKNVLYVRKAVWGGPILTHGRGARPNDTTCNEARDAQ